MTYDSLMLYESFIYIKEQIHAIPVTKRDGDELSDSNDILNNMSMIQRIAV